MPKTRFLSVIAVFGIILFGLLVRFYHISDNQFLFYDEGMYLGYNRAFLDLVAHNPAHNFNELSIILSLMLKTALTTAKALWFFILNLRVFFLGTDAWFFARFVSALSGLSTVVLLFFWVKRHYRSQTVAFLSSLFLLILPSHVFYSRLGMQEALSTLLFLSAIYLYMSVESSTRWQFVLSALLLACVFFTNYRMIIAPVFIAFIECFNTLLSKRRLNWKKLLVYFVIFYGFVFWVGSLYGGVNTHVTFAWMFHQAQDAGGKFKIINFLSYPYYVFVLEGFFFACLFWGNIYLGFCKEYSKLLPFGMVVFQMLIFSFAAEKGARYLCVVLPFMATAAAIVIDDLWQRWPIKARLGIVTSVVLSVLGMVYLSGSLALAGTDYEKAIQFVMQRDPQAIIVSTQPLVEGLFLTDDHRIVPCPQDLPSLFNLYKQGARYLILDPQMYISWTTNSRRFSPPLNDFLEFTLKYDHPLVVFPHLTGILLKRFVLDHNEQILDSITFLSQAKEGGYGQIRVYDLKEVLSSLSQKHLLFL